MEKVDQMVREAIREMGLYGTAFYEWILYTEKIKEMQQWLRDNPIDHRYDEECELFDGNAPAEQQISRMSYLILKELGKLPEELQE